MMRPKTATVSAIAELKFDVVIDVRTPSEYQLDHIPGAINYPVLSDEERITVGTLHNSSPFEARKLGAALISRNISLVIEKELATTEKGWRPLVYCWRGGLRSGSMAIILAQVGWPVHQLTNGYKAYRHMVIEQLPLLVEKCKLLIISGPTGSGKTHFLYSLKRAEAQIIDLEGLACHRGSVLGKVPGENQPSQRLFESRLLTALQEIDFDRPVYIESEGIKIGNISVPMALHKKMQESKCIYINVTMQERVRFLCEDYFYFLENPELLISNLSYLSEVHSKKKLEEWNILARNREFEELVTQLLQEHYDPCYHKSLRRHYPQIDSEDTKHIKIESLVTAPLDDFALKFLTQNTENDAKGCT